ncbi:MAG TPA: response regulator [Aggregatilineales bacterium]|nr:response regulator [Aggregatilineales bacterium]
MPLRERRALILDQEESNRMLLEYAMAMGRIDFDEADNARSLLELWKPGDYLFAFLNTEIRDMDGLSLVSRMRREDPNIAIVICSANDDPLYISAAVGAGCDMYLIKPYSLDMLMTLMKILDADNLRSASSVLIIDDQQRPRWEMRS